MAVEDYLNNNNELIQVSTDSGPHNAILGASVADVSDFLDNNNIHVQIDTPSGPHMAVLMEGSGGSSPLVSGAVDTYVELGDPVSLSGQLWFVRNNSSVIFPKYPRGFYYASSGVWSQTPMKVKVSEDAGSVINWTDWDVWVSGSFDIAIGDRVIYNGLVYVNDTGAQTSTNPMQDALNWDVADSNIIRYYNDTGADIQPFRVLHLKAATLISGKLHVTPELADSLYWEKTQGTLSVSCELILNGQFGCSVKDITKLTGGDTSSFPPGSQLWLSDDGTGELTVNKPEFPSYSISMGGNYNQTSAPNGEIFVNQTKDIYDTFNDAWDGAIRESFDFRVVSNGATITGTLTNQSFPSENLTMLFSDGLYTLDTTTAPLTLAIPEGTATTPLLSYVFIDRATKTLQSNIVGFPNTEHSKIAIIVVLTALITQTDGALRNQNFNDHLKSYNNNGHILHIAERIRKLNASWESGVAPTLTGLPNNLYVALTSGVVNQLHPQILPSQDMAIGDECHVINDPVLPYRITTNLNDITSYSSGSTWNNDWSNIVVWGVANKTGEADHIMVNLPSDGYNSEDNAINDRNNFSNYTIPETFKGVGFLIGRFTIRRSGSTFTYNAGVGFLDLRGSVPNNTVGGGTGSSGITDFTQLTDTPLSYVGQSGKSTIVNSGETALEFITETLQTVYNKITQTYHVVLNNIQGAFSIQKAVGYSGNFFECVDSAGDPRAVIDNNGTLIIGNGIDTQDGIYINQPAGGGSIDGLTMDVSVSGGAVPVNIRFGQNNANRVFQIDDNRVAYFDRYVQQEGIYGEILVENGTVTQSIPTGTALTKITAFNTAGLFANLSPDYINNELTLFVPGRYKVIITVTYETLTAGDWWNFSCVKNTNIQMRTRRVQSIVGVSQVVISKIVDGDAHDDFDLRVWHENVSSLSIKILDCVYSLIYTGTEPIV
ncbi:MAG: hypothetical protein GY804_06860 [Alphaproteobacteria bacterium]|nr:hypothetical protein [Alphaproteobacteria bacterium]